MGGRSNIIEEKSYQFAIRIINLYRYLNNKFKEYTLAKQILRSGTSIGANVQEAEGGQSRKDFSSKMLIAYKEARETKYWINLLYDTAYINEDQYKSLINDIEELCKILASIQKTTNKRDFQ